MKITKAHFTIMENTIRKNFNTEELENLKAEYISNNLSEKRLRWDIARESGLIQFICEYLYDYVNDNHIDTALRKITNTK